MQARRNQEEVRWLGDSYRLYLRDTAKISQQHTDALKQASSAVMDLDNATKDQVLPSIEEDIEMGDYQDIID